MRSGIVSLAIAELAVRVAESAAASAGLWIVLCVARSNIQSPVVVLRVPVSIVLPVDLFLSTSPLALKIA